jgi:peptidoglycan/LPS O-acetylase OafA/YrhL
VKPSNPRTALLAVVVDVILVSAFVLIGRASHSEGPLGTLVTLWPFLVGLAVGWLGSRAWRTPMRVRWTGITVWAATVIVGLLLRVVSGQGVQPGFVIVTTVVLAMFLIGWRGIALLVLRRRAVRP